LSPTPLGGVYSSISLSWLHVLAMFGTALVAAWLSLFDVIFSERGAWKRIGWLALGAGAVALALLVLPGSRQGLMPAMEFLTLSDGVGLATGEQRSLFAIFGRSAEPEPTRLWGWFAYLLPLAALGPWLHSRGAGRARGERRAAYVLALWVVFFGALAVSQVRYGNDCSPAASLAFALLLAATGRGLASRVPGRRRFGSLALAAASLLGVIGIWPALNAVFLPQAQASLAALRGESWPRERAATSVAATLSRFMREVRLLTPRTSGYLDPGKTPEYGVIAHPNLGHALQFRARRPTAADPFWANIGAENWAYTSAFLNAPSEEAALAAAQRLKARYVVTAPTQDRGTVHAQLHFFDGAESGTRPRLEHFRLITESATAGRSIFSRRRPDPPGSIAYKLFEIVRGVVLVVHAEPGSFVTASLPLSTPTGRELVYRASAIADEAGVVRLRLPYPTKGTAPVHSRERYRIQVGARHYPIELSEWAIRKGESVQLDATQ
jgi:asparagine N-glycosylation enzyme membrane subunit Stt3